MINELVNDITLKVKSVILNNNLIKNDDKIIVAVSGGPDSICLLHILYTLKDEIRKKYNINYSLIVAHVHHMIRDESDSEKIYVEEFCKNLDIPFYFLKENVPLNSKINKMSEETYARKIRYDFFNEILKKEKAQKIAVAHNLNDNVETILLNIIRGCGLNGLTGMGYTSQNIIRPLIDIEKKDILLYNDATKLNPCFDKTNNENIYARNKIRNVLIPELKNEYNSNVVENIIRMKNLLEQDDDFIENYTTKLVEESIIIKLNDRIEFNFKELLQEHISVKKRFIRQIIKKYKNSLEGIENVHIMDILKLLENNIKGKQFIIGNKFKIKIINKNIAMIN